MSYVVGIAVMPNDYDYDDFKQILKIFCNFPGIDAVGTSALGAFAQQRTQIRAWILPLA